MFEKHEKVHSDTLKNSKLLTDIFKELKLHPLVGIKLFVKNATINDIRLDTLDIPFYGHSIRIFRMGNSSNFTEWRISDDMATEMIRTFKRCVPEVRHYVLDKSNELFALEQETKDNIDLQIKRMLLSMYENQTVTITARISDYCDISKDEDAIKLRVSLSELKDPETNSVYADHTHVLVRESQIGLFAKLPIGTRLEFQATVHSYKSKDSTKFGIHNLQNIKVLERCCH
jgi:hypothetical protein